MLNPTSHSTEPVGIVFHLADGTIQGCNPDAEKILGYTAEQLIGASSFKPIWQTIHQDGSPFPPETHPAIVSLRTGEALSDVIMGFYRPNGELVWLSIDTQPLFQLNRSTPYAVVVTFKQRQNNEQASDNSLETAQEIQSGSEVAGSSLSSNQPLAPCQATVMLVEDSAEDRELYRRYLQTDSECKYTFVEAETGEEALEICQQDRPDIVLLDYLLPDMDGLEWLSLWQQTGENQSPVIVLTGQGDENIAVEFIKLGAANYLIKSQLTSEKLILEVKRSLAENHLRNEYHRALLNLRLATVAASLGMWFWDLTQNKLEWTEQCKALFGFGIEQEVSYEIFLNTLHPDDRDRTEQTVREALASKTEYSIEYRAVWSDGSIHWLAAKGRGFYNRFGEAVSMMGTVQDISQRKQTEAELIRTTNILQSIVRDSSDVIFVKDIEGRYIMANQSAADWLSISVEEMLGKDDAALFDPEIAGAIVEADRQVIAGKLLAFEEEFPHHATKRTLLTNKYPWRDETGNILGVIGVCRDITAIKQSEQKLKENEKLLRIALSNANAGSWHWEIDTGKVVWSPENYVLYGIDPRQEPQYQVWEQAVYPEDRERVNQQVKRVVLGELPEFRSEFRIVHPQRGVRWLLGIGSVTVDQNGHPIRLSGINIDITESKQIEEALRHSEQHLRRVLDSLYSFIGVLTPDGVLIEANRTALQAANLQPEEVLNKPFPETYWWSYSPEIQAQLKDSIRRAAAGEVVRYDVTLRLGADSYIIIDFSIVPLFDANGQVEYLIPSGIDISERETSKKALQQREKELRLITEAIPQQVWTALPNGEVDYVNQRWQEYTGVSRAEIQEHGWKNIVHPDDLQQVKESWAKAVQSGNKYNIEARLRGVDGIYRWFLGRARPLRDEQGKIIKWYGTNTSISQIKELEEKLRQQTEDLIRANQLKDEFLAIVSHELRTPLNPILGWSQLLAAGGLSQEQTKQGMEIIQRNAKLQSQLIEDLLDVSRILRGKLNLNRSPLNLDFVIKAALSTVQLAAQAKSIEIQTRFEPNIGQVLGDAGRLQQVVWNLVSNAIKFTPKNGQVTVKLEQVGTQAQIQVKDTGQGIEPDFLPYVFDRFRQAESSSTRRFGGLGLGLAIVYHLIELHGGTVWAQSQGKGQGASFTVQLPLIDSSILEISNSRSVMETIQQPGRLSNISVLVVDDEPDSRDLLAFVLDQQKAEVTTVASANEAIKALRELTPDLIISDIGMPEMDGYTLMTQIRALPKGKNIPAIALTAYAGEVDRQRCLEVGFQRYISKPINIPDLLNVITQLV